MGAIRTLELLDTWNINVEDGNVQDLLGVGDSGVVVHDCDFGPNRRTSGYPSVASVVLGDGSIRIHALKGVGKWSQTVSTGLGEQVVGLLGKPVGALGVVGKTVIGGIGSLGAGLFGIGKELVNDVKVGGEDAVQSVKKKGGFRGLFRGGGGGRESSLSGVVLSETMIHYIFNCVLSSSFSSIGLGLITPPSSTSTSSIPSSSSSSSSTPWGWAGVDPPDVLLVINVNVEIVLQRAKRIAKRVRKRGENN